MPSDREIRDTMSRLTGEKNNALSVIYSTVKAAIPTLRDLDQNHLADRLDAVCGDVEQAEKKMHAFVSENPNAVLEALLRVMGGA